MHHLLIRSLDGHLPEQSVSEVTFPVVATCVVIARLYLRKRHGIGLKRDDYTLAASLPLTWSIWALWYYVCHYIAPVSLLEANPINIPTYFKLFYVISLLWIIDVLIIKIAALLFYLGAFGTQRITRIIIYTLLGINVCHTIIHFLANVFTCRSIDVSTFWEHPQDCHTSVDSFIALSSINLACEVAILVLPIPIIWRLRAPIRTKLAILSVFLLGASTCATTATRIWVIWRNLHRPTEMGKNAGITTIIMLIQAELAGGTVTVGLTGIIEPLKAVLIIVLKAIKRSKSVPTVSASHVLAHGDIESGMVESKNAMSLAITEVEEDK